MGEGEYDASRFLTASPTDSSTDPIGELLAGCDSVPQEVTLASAAHEVRGKMAGYVITDVEVTDRLSTASS